MTWRRVAYWGWAVAIALGVYYALACQLHEGLSL